ncbi:hypothetical protein CDAR_13211 [Caerostris darwini]|uniref:Uncharacterized protein n=1 Tax=Caerostris darwini TaxID=1538125 RepID=A0AAV4QZ81_9ARAC|nr:hypothetical protein CDAR_13211 [Caerostris darwini]
MVTGADILNNLLILAGIKSTTTPILVCDSYATLVSTGLNILVAPLVEYLNWDRIRGLENSQSASSTSWSGTGLVTVSWGWYGSGEEECGNVILKM